MVWKFEWIICIVHVELRALKFPTGLGMARQNAAKRGHPICGDEIRGLGLLRDKRRADNGLLHNVITLQQQLQIKLW